VEREASCIEPDRQKCRTAGISGGTGTARGEITGERKGQRMIGTHKEVAQVNSALADAVLLFTRHHRNKKETARKHIQN